jgi:hypothetical protein
MSDASSEVSGRQKRAALRGGPLDGEPIAVPGLTAALIVFHEGDFHRYSIAAGSGRVGVAVPLEYETPVGPTAAGYRSI